MRFVRAVLLVILAGVVPTGGGPSRADVPTPRLAHAARTAADRLVVVESFMRDICPNCAGVGELLDVLEAEYDSSEVLILEHDSDNRKGERYSRWVVSGGASTSLPLTMIDSGHWAFGGPVESAEVLRRAIDAARLRPPLADVTATTVREQDSLTVTVQLRNLGQTRLDARANLAAAHAILYEPDRVHILRRFVRAVASAPLEDALEPGEAGAIELRLGPLSGMDWDNTRLLVLADYRPGASGPFDLLQATDMELPEEQRHAPTVDRVLAGEWVIDLVDRHGMVGTYASLALDATGAPHIAYRHLNQGSLRHAWRDEGHWSIETIDDQVDAGQHADLAIGPDGRLFASYYDRTNGDLKVAVRDGAGWRSETVDSDGDVGWHTSIAVDSAGQPRVSYVHAATGVLRYATRASDGWHVETVDAAVNQGAHWSLQSALARLTSIAVDASDRAHIAYYDDQGATLHYAVQREGGWRLEVADAAAYSGVDPSIAIDPSGGPRIAYSDYVNDRLKLATRLAHSWLPQVVDDQGLVGMGATLALDRQGRAHIMYREYGAALGAKVLRYARELGSGWEISTVDPGPKAGRYPSIALDADDQPHVAFYDDDFQNLRYAERPTPTPQASSTPTDEPSPTATPTATPGPTADQPASFLPLVRRGGPVSGVAGH